MSLRRLKDVENANLEDILYGCLKDISCSGKTFLKEFLEILTNNMVFKAMVKDILKVSLQYAF